MKKQTCCFTGHRNLSAADPELEARLERAIREQIAQGVIYFGSGGALGFDTLAARTVLRLREEFPAIRLILVLPCKDQTAGWPKKSVAEYEDILRQCDKQVWLAEKYYPGCMQARNRYLVDHSQVCLCYLTRPKGGTRYTVDYCKRRGVEVINLG